MNFKHQIDKSFEKGRHVTAGILKISVQSVDTSLPCHRSIYNEDKERRKGGSAHAIYYYKGLR